MTLFSLSFSKIQSSPYLSCQSAGCPSHLFLFGSTDLASQGSFIPLGCDHLWFFHPISSAESPILCYSPPELGSHIQATKVLNGTHPGPRSSCAHALMLQSLPSRDFFSLKSLFAIHTIFRIATELYKPCAVRFTVPIPVYTCCFLPSGDALPRLQV